MKKTLRMGDLLHLDDAVKKRLVTMVDSKNLVMEGSYNAAPISVDEMWAWLEKYAAIFKDYICDVGQYLACLLYTSTLSVKMGSRKVRRLSWTPKL